MTISLSVSLSLQSVTKGERAATVLFEPFLEKSRSICQSCLINIRSLMTLRTSSNFLLCAQQSISVDQFSPVQPSSCLHTSAASYSFLILHLWWGTDTSLMSVGTFGGRCRGANTMPSGLQRMRQAWTQQVSGLLCDHTRGMCVCSQDRIDDSRREPR